MADFILRHKEFPEALQKSMAERLYLEDVKDGDIFSPFTLAQTAKVSVNPKTMRPYLSRPLGDVRRHAPTCR